MKNPLWTPSADRISNSNISAFMRYVEQLLDKPFKTYDALYNWSVTETEEFWKSIWVLSGIIYSKQYDNILSGYEMPGAKWFEGSRFNFAENLLRYRDSNTAIISSREDHPDIIISYSELYTLTAACSEALREMGLKQGDRVAGLVSNTPEAVVAMLASAGIGASWSSCSPDFGWQAVVDRFGQIKPKILFAAETFRYNGKVFSNKEKINLIIEKIPGIEKVILIPEFSDLIPLLSRDRKKIAGDQLFLSFNDLIFSTDDNINFEQLPFDHPLYIMYSSGTTGKPKCIVHGAGGTLLQHYKELSLHTDLTRHDVITYYTTCSWMMWNWLISSLQIGAAIYLYDGNPFYPDVTLLWKQIEEKGITIFGTSPRYLRHCSDSNLIPSENFNLQSLKTILSTGAPLGEDLFKWIYNSVKKDLLLSSISGGTDIISCFALGNPALPVYAGEIQCRGLGMNVEAYDEDMQSVINRKGELVCTKVFPSMPVFFWNDPDMKKYRSAYFEKFPGVWHHGDFIEINDRGGVIIYGRSDAVLKPGGVRIGTAEIYNIVENMEEIKESLAAGKQMHGDTRIVLFVVLKEGFALNEDLINKIKSQIRISASPRHVPSFIIQVNDIPRTMNGKKTETAVTRIIHGENIDNKEALANPESLGQFKNILHLLSE